MAVEAARRHVEAGLVVTVDVDLDRFFDRVSHDVLMARVSRKVTDDKKVKRLIGTYLRAGVMADGVKHDREEGTPQGSPLSPLLANVMLDDLDRELESRGHAFVRYADDIRVFVRTERAGERVLHSITSFVEQRLKLRVNREKSMVARASQGGLLGFGFFWMTGGVVALRVHPKAMKAMKDRIRRLTSRTWGVSMEVRIAALNKFIRGWMAYFGQARTSKVFATLDKWLLHRLRQVRWKEWKRFGARRRNLLALGVSPKHARMTAGTRKGSWAISGGPLNSAMPRAYWSRLGLLGFSESARRRWLD